MSQTSKLLQNAHDDGDLSQQSLTALNNIRDIGAEIQNGLGLAVDELAASEVVLLSVLVDDSGSIRSSSNEQPIREGHNMLIQALKDSKQQDNIIVLNRYLNGTVLYPYTDLDQVPEMDKQNYQANGGTPLYDETAKLLGTVIAKAQEFKDNGIQVRTITLIMSDGQDVHSRQCNESDVKSIVTDMLATEEHIIAAMGFDNQSTDFEQVFSEMGIPSEWILTAQSNGSDIRKAFQVFSQSAVRASQSAANFSKVGMGGFGS